MTISIFILGVITGGIVTWLIARSMTKSAEEVKKELRQQVQQREMMINQIKGELDVERQKEINLKEDLAIANTNISNMQSKLVEQKQEVEELQRKFSDAFENLANKILEDKSKRFTEQNKEYLTNILDPLQVKIKDFEKKVNDVYTNETKERALLLKQVQDLQMLNQQMSKDANNLTNALKGQSKTKGDWGELILEEILERSGLVKGTHYLIQESLKDEDGRKKPDVIIKLPESKHIIIDSKVSLNAYDNYCSTENEDEQGDYLKMHINSIRKHIDDLSKKKYQNLYQLQSLDFVLMFIPIEPAFGLAVQNDLSLWNDAFEKNIVIVTTSTLLATLRTIANIWRQENQNKNAMEIARRSGELYDKFVAFVEDLKGIGDKIDDTQKCYESALNKLSTGRGNLIKRVEEIKKLGAKTSKVLPQSLLDNSSEII